MKNFSVTLLITTFALLSATSQAGEKQLPLVLSEDIQKLLTEEMKAIQKGMQEIIPALVSGNWKALQSTGNKIHDSYIMKKALTSEQKHELHAKLPTSFKTLDHDLHHTAGQLAKAAMSHDAQLVSFYYYKMTESCVACHTSFASSRFPELKRPAENEELKH